MISGSTVDFIIITDEYSCFGRINLISKAAEEKRNLVNRKQVAHAKQKEYSRDLDLSIHELGKYQTSCIRLKKYRRDLKESPRRGQPEPMQNKPSKVVKARKTKQNRNLNHQKSPVFKQLGEPYKQWKKQRQKF